MQASHRSAATGGCEKKPRAGPPLLDSGYEESRGRKPSSRRE
ncbi:MAG: hypothetical protein OXH92_12410 [Bryobacterales bacterium]|nr:hypothetical protein [Bryobacterales bacterium]